MLWCHVSDPHDTTPLDISDTLEASTRPGCSSSSSQKGCTPLLQPWCASRHRPGTSPKHWQPEFGTCFALSAGITSPQMFVDSRTARKKRQDQASSLLPFAVSATVLVPPSGSTKSQVTMVGVAGWMCGALTIDAPNLRRVSLKSGRQFSVRFLST